MPIVPEDKNWTWVLERPCPQCGFVAADLDVTQMPEMVRAMAAQWPALLAHPQANVRPTDDLWSAVEYGCHVRDVIELFDYRLTLMLREDDPTFANWDQDQTAIDNRYHEADPAEVARQIVAAGDVGAARYMEVDGIAGGWSRKGLRSDGAVFTIESFARYMLHDPVHHIWDVEQGYRTLAQ
jgi:hypothetical protein